MTTDDDEAFLQHMDTQPLAFGKHQGETPEQVAKTDPSYIRWVFETIRPKVCSAALNLAVDEAVQAERAARSSGGSGHRKGGHDYGGSLRGEYAKMAANREFDFDDDVPY